MKLSARSIEDIEQVARAILKEARKNKVVCFRGAMGTGKTTLIAEICKQLKVEDRISSPTFSLVNEYFSSTEGTIFHFDFYRIDSEEEALDMGVEEYLYSNAFCFLEWPEKIENLLPLHYLEVTIEQDKEHRIYKLIHV